MKKNEYVLLASRSFTNLCDLATALQPSLSGPSDPDFVEEVFHETHRLWSRLVWSDRILTSPECAVLDAIEWEAVGRIGYRRAERRVDVNDLLDPAIPEFLRCAAERDPRLASQMIGHLESFGYAVLAADREIHEDELVSLQSYVRRLREGIEAPRPAVPA